MVIIVVLRGIFALMLLYYAPLPLIMAIVESIAVFCFIVMHIGLSLGVVLAVIAVLRWVVAVSTRNWRRLLTTAIPTLAGIVFQMTLGLSFSPTILFLTFTLVAVAFMVVIEGFVELQHLIKSNQPSPWDYLDNDGNENKSHGALSISPNLTNFIGYHIINPQPPLTPDQIQVNLQSIKPASNKSAPKSANSKNQDVVIAQFEYDKSCLVKAGHVELAKLTALLKLKDVEMEKRLRNIREIEQKKIARIAELEALLATRLNSSCGIAASAVSVVPSTASTLPVQRKISTYGSVSSLRAPHRTVCIDTAKAPRVQRRACDLDIELRYVNTIVTEQRQTITNLEHQVEVGKQKQEELEHTKKELKDELNDIKRVQEQKKEEMLEFEQRLRSTELEQKQKQQQLDARTQQLISDEAELKDQQSQLFDRQQHLDTAELALEKEKRAQRKEKEEFQDHQSKQALQESAIRNLDQQHTSLSLSVQQKTGELQAITAAIQTRSSELARYNTDITQCGLRIQEGEKPTSQPMLENQRRELAEINAHIEFAKLRARQADQQIQTVSQSSPMDVETSTQICSTQQRVQAPPVQKPQRTMAPRLPQPKVVNAPVMDFDSLMDAMSKPNDHMKRPEHASASSSRSAHVQQTLAKAPSAASRRPPATAETPIRRTKTSPMDLALRERQTSRLAGVSAPVSSNELIDKELDDAFAELDDAGVGSTIIAQPPTNSPAAPMDLERKIVKPAAKSFQNNPIENLRNPAAAVEMMWLLRDMAAENVSSGSSGPMISSASRV
ncbi:hypothetical protein BC829DRAFT_486137 [Chytridium lagenaria]|nr:hypothetical protein BC829DRAFT_486137 [Chytridium lagenaria]